MEKENFGDLTKILVPIDFSAASDNAYSYAMNLAKEMNGVIRLVHVYRPNMQLDPEKAILTTKETKEYFENRLEKYAKQINNSFFEEHRNTPYVVHDIIDGFPGEKLVEYAKKNKTNLIVIGSTGQSKLSKKILGSVTTQVAHNSECPVLIVPPEVTYKEHKNILFAVNDINLDVPISSYITDMATENSTIHLLNINPDRLKSYPFEKLRKVIGTEIPSSKMKISTIKSTDVIGSINSYMEENEIDLLAVGSRTRSFLDELFHYSVSKKLTIESMVPVLIINKKLEI